MPQYSTCGLVGDMNLYIVECYLCCQYSSSKLDASSLAKRNRSKAMRYDKSELEQTIYIESSTLHMSFIIIRSSHLYIQRLKAE